MVIDGVALLIEMGLGKISLNFSRGAGGSSGCDMEQMGPGLFDLIFPFSFSI